MGGFGFPSLLDSGLFRTLGLSFLLAFSSLVSVVIIFTLFEMWRFIARNEIGARLVARYILFLLPLITVELFPATMLIAVLMTYALLARRSETIAWWASGQSVYRLMIPGLVFALAAGAGTWVVQEYLMPNANLTQDKVRARIRGGEPRGITGTGRTAVSEKLHRQLRATQKLAPCVFAEESREVPARTLRELAELTRNLLGRVLERQPRMRSTFP